ncbi:MAG: hypothetical protein MJ188_09755 [Treponema sp.]|nr:hypothetical protein [Treponema sp.]
MSTNIITNSETENFEQIDISTFFEQDSDSTLVQREEKAEMLTKRQRSLIQEIIPVIQKIDKEKAESFQNRLNDLERLAQAVARFPSLLERHKLIGGVRTPTSLIDSLIAHQDSGDATLQLPSKAILGKGLLVAKTHTLSSMQKYILHMGPEYESTAKAFETETVSSMFSLLVEDVYLNLIRDTSQPMDFRREWALSLLLLWEHWNDQTIETVAPVLQSVWTARRKLAPAFGTMMGTSELLLISMQMDDQWISFIKNKMGDTGVSQAMEEFLFGISYEQILSLRSILKEKGIPAIGRDEVSKFLGEHVKSDAGLDYRDFYSLYTVRRDNARSRARLHLEGPYKTLEDYFIQFVTEQNKEKQNNDTFAKS